MIEQNEQELVRQAMSILGRAKTEKKTAAARAVAESRRGVKWTEDQKANLRAAQAARREREKAERAALGIVEEPKEKKKPGRPKTRPDVPEGEKRPVGRPKKQAGQETASAAGDPENGA